MRMITVRQPWAEAIAAGAKLIENRSKGFPKRYRGLLAIHAGTQPSMRGFLDDRIRALTPRPTPTCCTFGAVVALAELVDVHPAEGCCAPWGEQSYQPANPERRRVGQVTHLVLEDVHRIDPIPAKGALGLWRPDADLALEVAHRIADWCTWDLERARAVADMGRDYDADLLWAAFTDRSAPADVPS